ncbi:hypothetical protein [Candidatus Bathycorpusculum sp.]|uniref:hypothetical protein n=1 Tax=Candidatus Bathycorpusculum sp. TaxID=2994959 RepID=UPI0028383E0E|nr:hypothetical protein [Candidatus Termitimicrobium sp.]MCL2686082.1 hypothetical protein [Candidatus Termitimicrobium sp.]
MGKNIGPRLCSDTNMGTNIIYDNGNWLTSENGVYRTILQDNGRFFVYAGKGTEIEMVLKQTNRRTHPLHLSP